MPEVSDFTVIQGDSDVTIGDSRPIWEKSFDIGGGHSGQAFISLMVRGLSLTSKNPEVRINDKEVGEIFNSKGGKSTHWSTQTINIGGGILKNGQNQLEIRGVTYEGGGNDHYDDFTLRDVICFYHQSL